MLLKWSNLNMRLWAILNNEHALPQIQPENINIAFDASELLFWNN